MLFGLFAGEAPAPAGAARTATVYGLEPLESRVFMSATPNLAIEEIDSVKDLNKVPQLTQQLRRAGLNVGRLVNISIQDIRQAPTVNAEGNLTGTINAVVRMRGGQTTTVPVTWTLERPAMATAATDLVTTQQVPTDCPILHLELGPIDLNLLGLRVLTSEICLDIGANEGPGNLLGNLLCGLTGLLDNLGTAGVIGQVTGVLNQLLPVNLGVTLDRLVANNGVVSGLGTLSLGIGGSTVTQALSLPLFGDHDVSTQQAVCQILNLDLGPLDLNLLGLVVGLDNCANGPVTVDVTAIPGPGNLLGNLLCGIAGVLDSGLSLGQLNRLIRNVNRLLDRLDNLLN
jgi:hypothetical protein